MNKIVEAAETLSDLNQEKQELQKEVGRLKKMIKTGFEGKFDGLDKTAKVFSSDLNADLEKFYNQLANSIKAIQVLGNFEKFKSFIQLNHSIDIVDFETKVSYIKKDKKKQKFLDLYNAYFLEDAPAKASEAMTKILTSMQNNYKEVKKETDKIKEEFEQINTTAGCPKRTLQTLCTILSKAKAKDIEVSDVTSEIETKMSEEQMALDLLEKENE